MRKRRDGIWRSLDEVPWIPGIIVMIIIWVMLSVIDHF